MIYNRDTAIAKERNRFVEMIKRLNKIYKSLIIDNKGLIIPDVLDSSITYGRHFSKIEEGFFINGTIEDDKCIRLYVEALYEIAKEKNGKFIKSIYRNNESIYLDYDDDSNDSSNTVLIGDIIDRPNNMNLYRLIDVDTGLKEIPNEMILDAIEKYSTIRGDINMDFSKYIIPNLSDKKSKLWVSLISNRDAIAELFVIEGLKNNSSIKPVLFRHIRDAVTSFHIYIVIS